MAKLALLGAALALAVSGTVALAQSGPVATACKDDIAKLCAGKKHNGEVRSCLEANKAKVAAACKTALDTTGPGKGAGKGKK
ncbi:MAG: cysteine rich repeat-containing protein [Hyphomicrobiaceae bacterium]